MLQGLPMALRHVKAGNSHLNTVNWNKYQSKATMFKCELPAFTFKHS